MTKKEIGERIDVIVGSVLGGGYGAVKSISSEYVTGWIQIRKLILAQLHAELNQVVSERLTQRAGGLIVVIDLRAQCIAVGTELLIRTDVEYGSRIAIGSSDTEHARNVNALARRTVFRIVAKEAETEIHDQCWAEGLREAQRRFIASRDAIAGSVIERTAGQHGLHGRIIIEMNESAKQPYVARKSFVEAHHAGIGCRVAGTDRRIVICG